MTQNSSKIPSWKVSIEYGPTAHDIERIVVEAVDTKEARILAEKWAIDNHIRSPMINEPVEIVEGDFTDYLEWTEEEEEAFLDIVEKKEHDGNI